jgi:hypothetical protein
MMSLVRILQELQNLTKMLYKILVKIHATIRKIVQKSGTLVHWTEYIYGT